MTEIKTRNRWWIVIAAVVLELALGAIYAWSAYVPSFTTVYFWTTTQTQIPYSVGLASFAIVVVFAGRLKERLGARLLIILSAAALGGGYLLGGILPITPLWTTLTVGLIGGAGIGFAYAIPISTGTKWFPDKKGLVVGLGMAGFGAGSLIWMYLFNGVLSKLSKPLMWTFIIYGVLYAGFVMFSYFFLEDPPKDYSVPGWTPPKVVSKTGEKIVVEDFTSKEMLRTPQFWYIFVTFLVGAGAGLMTIGIAKKWPTDVLTDLGFPTAIVSIATTIAASVIYPIFNGLGRISWGWFSDKIGWKWAMLIMNAVQTVFLFLIIVMVRHPVALAIGMAVLAFNYGGNFSLFPQATDQTFGSKNLSSNYGWVFFSYGVGGLLFPIIGGAFNDAGLQIWAFILAGILLAGCVALIYITKKPTKRA